MSKAPIDEGRRRLCQAACAASGLVILSAVPGCGDDPGEMAQCSAGAVGVGSSEDLAVGQARFVPAIKVFVCHDDAGYYAIDAACTHVGTDVEFQTAATGFRCPLHGSTFSFEGKVTLGPATMDLPHYSLCKTESGLLLVDINQRVTADTRLVD